MAKTNSAMTHVPSAKVRRNEQLWQILDIDIMFEPTFGFNFFIVKSIEGINY